MASLRIYRNHITAERLAVSRSRICSEPTRSLLSLTEPSSCVLDSHSSLFVFRERGEREKKKKDILAFFKVIDIISLLLGCMKSPLTTEDYGDFCTSVYMSRILLPRQRRSEAACLAPPPPHARFNVNVLLKKKTKKKKHDQSTRCVSPPGDRPPRCVTLAHEDETQMVLHHQ